MEDIIENFAERLGIEPNAARQGISITTSRYFLQNIYIGQIFYITKIFI